MKTEKQQIDVCAAVWCEGESVTKEELIGEYEGYCAFELENEREPDDFDCWAMLVRGLSP